MKELIKEICENFDDRQNKLNCINQVKIGYCSVYTPIEIIEAAGLIPVRLFGSNQLEYEASGLMHNNMCSYVLGCLNEGVQAFYNNMQGVVVAGSCDHRKRMYDAWSSNIENRFSFYIHISKGTSYSASYLYFKKQIENLIENLENSFQINISDKHLIEAISKHNKKRKLLKLLTTYRHLLTGIEYYSILKSSMCYTSIDRFNDQLEILIQKLALNNQENKKNNLRLMLCGSYFDHPLILTAIEEYGGSIVCDDLSIGQNYFQNEIEIDENPIEAIAKYYFNKPSTTTFLNVDDRFSHLEKIAIENKAHSILYFTLKFCDNNLFDYPFIRKKFLEKGIQTMFLESELDAPNMENLKTRIQTFIETNLN